MCVVYAECMNAKNGIHVFSRVNQMMGGYDVIDNFESPCNQMKILFQSETSLI